MLAIETHDLRKRYGDVAALDGIDLRVERGEVFCLLGPNGAGKTTATEILIGRRAADGGSARVLGRDPALRERALREQLGVVPQHSGVQLDLTVGELLEMYGRWYARRRTAEELIALVELDARRDTRARALSGGQRRRLDLALALAGCPRVLFLDEPTTGFDPHARRHAWSTIRELCALGLTVVLTTHFMDEAQALADRVAVLVDGRVVAAGTPQELGGRDELPTEIRFALPAGVARADLPRLSGAAVTADGDDDRVLVTAQDGLAATHALTGWALERGLALSGFAVTQPTLEDVYLALTGQRDGGAGASRDDAVRGDGAAADAARRRGRDRQEVPA